jgi:beta-lactamase regulating signal transducer with metallopeptidase domain
MIDYLIKVTLIWALLLALYELLYRKSPAYTLNRVYLFLALFAGLLLPLIPLPEFIGKTSALGEVSRNMQRLNKGMNPAAPQAAAAPAGSDIGAATVLWWLYSAGALIAFLISLRELVLILRTAIYGQYSTISTYRIFSSSKPHAPFSFMGWVFISDPSLYDEDSLEYIFRHEDAHNRRWHWLDTILIQLFFVVFWFHPLVWRYRYLLKLNHEYEADYYAAGNNAYEYGHFLLQQTLLKGTPSIAHSFHFSPIKNRINMLTKTKKRSGWRYAFTVPLLLGCTLLFAESNKKDERVKVGNKTTYKGHEFEWTSQPIDTLEVEDPTTGERRFIISQGKSHIRNMDGDSIYTDENNRVTPAQFRHNNQDLIGYTMPLLKKEATIPDSIRIISLSNMIIDESGKLRYYDIECITGKGYYVLSDPASPLRLYGKVVDRIMDGSPAWLPALIGGRKVKMRMAGQQTIYMNMPESR